MYAKLKYGIYTWTNVLFAVQLLQSLRVVSGSHTYDNPVLIHGGNVSVFQATCVWHLWGWSWVGKLCVSINHSLSWDPPSLRAPSHRLRDHTALCPSKPTLLIIRLHLSNWKTKSSCKLYCCDLLLHIRFVTGSHYVGGIGVHGSWHSMTFNGSRSSTLNSPLLARRCGGMCLEVTQPHEIHTSSTIQLGVFKRKWNSHRYVWVEWWVLKQYCVYMCVCENKGLTSLLSCAGCHRIIQKRD